MKTKEKTKKGLNKIDIPRLHLMGEKWERELIDKFFVGNNFAATFEQELIYFIHQLLSNKNRR